MDTPSNVDNNSLWTMAAKLQKWMIVHDTRIYNSLYCWNKLERNDIPCRNLLSTLHQRFFYPKNKKGMNIFTIGLSHLVVKWYKIFI